MAPTQYSNQEINIAAKARSQAGLFICLLDSKGNTCYIIGMAMKPHSIRFTDRDYATLEQLATKYNMSTNALVHAACKHMVETCGLKWEGAQPKGRPKAGRG